MLCRVQSVVNRARLFMSVVVAMDDIKAPLVTSLCLIDCHKYHIKHSPYILESDHTIIVSQYNTDYEIAGRAEGHEEHVRINYASKKLVPLC